MRKRIRRRELAEQFSVNIRTIDAWAKTGALPKPHYLPGSRVPLWYADEVEKSAAINSKTVTA